MRLRNVPGAQEHLDNSKYIVKDPETWKGRWHDFFGNDRPLRVEIGTGKGRFIVQMAEENPDINYIGIEKYTSVLYRAVQKQDVKDLPNLFFLLYDAELVENLFTENEVDRIYLNFSDPWPKKAHAHRRLPSKEFLRRYGRILQPEGTVEFKTDNRGLFDFALEEIGPGGFAPVVITFDLHADPVLNEGNIMTEYEERFSGKGNPICKYIIRKEHISPEE